MSSKSIPLSFRVNDEDAEFLAGLDMPGAVTPSEKLRGLLTRARVEHGQTRDLDASLERIREWIEPTRLWIRDFERSGTAHSELLSKTMDAVPDLLATLVAAPVGDAPKAATLKQFEASVGAGIFRLIEAILRLGVTTRAPCYNPELLAEGLAGTLELSRLIASRGDTSEGSTS